MSVELPARRQVATVSDYAALARTGLRRQTTALAMQTLRAL